MNKTEFIKELSKQTGYDEQKCILINDIIENYFIFVIMQPLRTQLFMSKEKRKFLQIYSDTKILLCK